LLLATAIDDIRHATIGTKLHRDRLVGDLTEPLAQQPLWDCARFGLYAPALEQRHLVGSTDAQVDIGDSWPGLAGRHLWCPPRERARASGRLINGLKF